MHCLPEGLNLLEDSIRPITRKLYCAIAAYAGPMTQKSADIIVEQTCERINEEKLPLFVTDGRKYYKQAVLDRYGFIKEFPGTGKWGRPRKPEQMPLPELKYAQVVKKKEGCKVVDIEKRIIFGEENDIHESLICTSHIGHQNLTSRQENNRLARKTLGFYQRRRMDSKPNNNPNDLP